MELPTVQVWRKAAAYWGDWDNQICLYLGLPLGVTNDELGHGAVYRYNPQALRLEPTPFLEIRLRFPARKFTGHVMPVPESLGDRFSLAEFSAVEISVGEDAVVAVDGFGLPFNNPGHETHDWVNNGSTVAGSMTFVNILQQRKWRIIVEEKFAKMKRLWERSIQQCRDLRQRDREDWTVPASHDVPSNFPPTRRHLISGQNRATMHAVLRKGRGFFDLWETHQNPEFHGMDGSSEMKWTLPAANILHSDEIMLKCLMMEIPAPDRGRFVQYMSNLPLGFGIISAGPRFGKTAAICVATLCLADRVNSICATAPTAAAVDQLAIKLNDFDMSSGTRQLHFPRPRGQDFVNPKMIVRGHSFTDEIEAFLELLERPNGGDRIVLFDSIGRPRWKLYLSATYWLLIVLGSPAVPAIPLTCFPRLQSFRQQLMSHPDSAVLVDVATGRLSWAEYANMGHISRTIDFLALKLLNLIILADVVCITPNLSRERAYHWWLITCAGGIAVDDAHSMTRSDLYFMGNNMIPCLLAGDERQFLPTGTHNNLISNSPFDRQLSALAFYKANSWPVYRPRVPLRTARGMFDLCRDIFYDDAPALNYSSLCDPLAHLRLNGVKLERWLQQWYGSTTSHRLPLAPAAGGYLRPVFVNVRASKTWRNYAPRAVMNPKQCVLALHMLRRPVMFARVDPCQIRIVTADAGNVHFLRRLMLSVPCYSMLQGMPPPATVEESLACEEEIVCAILGRSRNYGPGAMLDANRLNVMLSRHQSGLIIVGDFAAIKSERVQENGERKRRREEEDEPGFGRELIIVKDRKIDHEEALKKVYQWVKTRGRFIDGTLPRSGMEREEDVFSAFTGPGSHWVEVYW
ncbi:hypothetical protein BBK36DRAFT_1162363 [Trichoderma citrinoviride]|uniref:DNA2/NAM7 helicase-like C-terminal domain-containing protein n=1 Tax=Trichoderma citrinoviride TaxID=58853 RepID=A0A2T4B179_9HYPO|nr:hypothetical protein BBK36DRAFT_1162363 [Trichoderma citrinoviride]PTB63060.1 hypothetical protein BBK36DRAFT_1162363 [Trichoderma citrinoviride]